MYDFVDWCQERSLIEISEDGTVSWKEDCDKEKAQDGKKITGVRDTCKDDLSSDYKGHFRHMKTVWPFKLRTSKKACKPVSPVGK